MSGELISTIRGKVPQRAIRHIDELPYAASYSLGLVDYGEADVPHIIATPASRRSKVIEVQIGDVTEAFTSTTTAARIDIGDGSDADGFGLTDDFADGLAGQVFTSYDDTITEGALGAIIEGGDQVTITCVAATGGSPDAGIAYTTVTLIHFQ